MGRGQPNWYWQEDLRSARPCAACNYKKAHPRLPPNRSCPARQWCRVPLHCCCYEQDRPRSGKGERFGDDTVRPASSGDKGAPSVVSPPTNLVRFIFLSCNYSHPDSFPPDYQLIGCLYCYLLSCVSKQSYTP